MTGISYRSTIKKLGKRDRAVRARKTKNADGSDGIEVEREFLGYGVVLDGSHECLVFDEPPPFEVGDKVEVTIKKIDDEP